MTEIPVLAPPVLYLPSHPLAYAEACVEDARKALAVAERVEWVSGTAKRYQGELAELGSAVAALAASVAESRDLLMRARAAALAQGQL